MRKLTSDPRPEAPCLLLPLFCASLASASPAPFVEARHPDKNMSGRNMAPLFLPHIFLPAITTRFFALFRVGPAVARRAPHRPGLAQLTHPVLHTKKVSLGGE